MKKVDVAVANLLECELFLLFNLEKTFDIDLNILDQRYFELQKKYHPDKYQYDNFFAYSSHITKSYLILKSPLKRAQYLLSLENIIVNSDDKNAIKVSDAILENILIDREKLLFLDNEDDYNILRQNQTELKNKLISMISDNFDHKNYDVAAQNTIHLSYVMKLLEELDKL